MKIYLAGGMKSGWQQRVYEQVHGVTFIDPCQHGLDDPQAFTLWDLTGVALCDGVFAYLEKSNPGGVGLALEIGYAKALGKWTIFVDEQQDRRFAMVRAAADVTVNTLEDGLRVLNAMGKLHAA